MKSKLTFSLIFLLLAIQVVSAGSNAWGSTTGEPTITIEFDPSVDQYLHSITATKADPDNVEQQGALNLDHQYPSNNPSCTTGDSSLSNPVWNVNQGFWFSGEAWEFDMAKPFQQILPSQQGIDDGTPTFMLNSDDLANDHGTYICLYAYITFKLTSGVILSSGWMIKWFKEIGGADVPPEETASDDGGFLDLPGGDGTGFFETLPFNWMFVAPLILIPLVRRKR